VSRENRGGGRGGGGGGGGGRVTISIPAGSPFAWRTCAPQKKKKSPTECLAGDEGEGLRVRQTGHEWISRDQDNRSRSIGDAASSVLVEGGGGAAVRGRG
jgi:hypothetical protein